MPAFFTRAAVLSAACLVVLLLTPLGGCSAKHPRISTARVQGSVAADVRSGGGIMGRVIETDYQDPWPATVTVHTLGAAPDFEKSVKAEESGYYWLGDLPAGIYRMEIMLVGFVPAARDSIRVEAGRITVVDIELAVDPLARVMN